MNIQRISPLLLLLLISALSGVALTPAWANTTDWPRWSGPYLNLTADGNGLFSQDGVQLEVAWTRPLGSSYSGNVIAGDRLVTAFSDVKDDFLVALRTSDGQELWRYRIAEVYKGHDGSDDGVLATPTLQDGVVYGLGGFGHLVAVGLDNGQLRWARKLDVDFGAKAPDYGFTSAPLVVGKVVVVQAGGANGKSILGLDRHTGELLWSTGDDPVDYQSPTLLQVGGEEQLLAINNGRLLGLVPATGKVLWQQEHKAQELGTASQPVPIGEGQVLVNYWPESVLYRIEKQDDNYRAAEVWRTTELKGTYAVPAPYEGHIYGFNGRFLTCVDALTGKAVWKSRPPGGGNLALVDGHLLIQAPNGELVVAAASPAGYQEKARLSVFERGSITAPSFAGGRVYLRNLKDITSIKVSPGGARPAVATAPAEMPANELRGAFGDFVRRVSAASNQQAAIDEFLAAHPSFPIYEGERLVHLVFQGDVKDLVVNGNMAFGQDLPMQRIPGTDFFYRSFELEPGALYTYRFFVYEQGMPDPKNPHKVGRPNEMASEIRMPGWQEPAHLKAPQNRRGRVEELPWKSTLLENERKVKVYLPPGYDQGQERYPLLVVYSGDRALGEGLVENTLENLIGSRIAPLIVAFVPRAAWAEYGGPRTDLHGRAIAEELVPTLDRTYRTRTERQARAVWGMGSAALAAAMTALQQSATFSKAALQSFFVGEPGAKELLNQLVQGEKRDLTWYLEWSRSDFKDTNNNSDAQADSQQLAQQLSERGYPLVKNEVGDGVGWASWRSRTDRILEQFFPAQ